MEHIKYGVTCNFVSIIAIIIVAQILITNLKIMEMSSGNIPTDEKDISSKHLDNKAVHTTFSNNQEQDSAKKGKEKPLLRTEDNEEKEETISCDDRQIEKGGKDDESSGTLYRLDTMDRQSSNQIDNWPQIRDGSQQIQNTADISRQSNLDVSRSDTYFLETADNHLAENNNNEKLGTKVIQCIDDYENPNKNEISCFGKTSKMIGFKGLKYVKRNVPQCEKHLHKSIKQFFKKYLVGIYDMSMSKFASIFKFEKKCLTHVNVNNLKNTLTVLVYPIFIQSSSESDSENEATGSENETHRLEYVSDVIEHETIRQENVSPGIENETSGNEVLSSENETLGLGSYTSRQENEENLPVMQDMYLSDYGNIVCQPTEELPFRPLPCVQADQQYSVSDNHMVICSDSRTESNLGQTIVTVESSGATLNCSIVTSISSLDSCHRSIQVTEGTRVPKSSPVWYTDSYKGLPVLLANPVGAGFQDTCTLDPGLMILLYQSMTNPSLLHNFTHSLHRIFKTVLPELLELFLKRKFETIRQKWAELIGWKGNNFYGRQTDVMMPPFAHLLHFNCSYKCTETTCPANNRIICIQDLRLSCPSEELDCRRLQLIIDKFEHEEMNPCGEPIHHTRPDRTVMNPITTSFTSNTKSQCNGRQVIERTVDTSTEQPPVIVLNMVGPTLSQFVKSNQVGNLNGTVKIGGINYYIGGTTFWRNQHFTARILLPNQLLFYDNLKGVQPVTHENPQELEHDILQLIFLFKI